MNSRTLLIVAGAVAVLALLPVASAQGVTFSSNALHIAKTSVSVFVADMDSDGKPDIVALPSSLAGYDGRVLVLTNNGSGVFGTNVTLYPPGLGRLAAVADLNGDGRPDLLYLNNYANTLVVVTNGGGRIYGSNATYSVPNYPLCAVAADVNGDSRMDVACANRSSALVLTNGGGASLGSNATYSVGTYALCAVAADVNRDGAPDLITANFQANTLTVLTNDGHGSFGLSATLPTGDGPQCVIATDVRGDGNLALICANAGGYPNNGNTLTVFTNDGSGVFGSNATLSVGTFPVCVAAADLNLDGKLDLVCLNRGSNTLTVLTNDGSGGFGFNATLGVGFLPAWVAAADLNGDGKPDLVCADGNGLTLLLNTTPFPPPVLGIAPTGNQLMLSWPGWASNYVLESSTDLSHWAPFTNGTPIPCGVSLTNTSPAAFFRLHQP